MTNTLELLKSKSKLLRSKLARNGIKLPISKHLDLFAKMLGERSWEALVRSYQARPRPHTDYRLRGHLISQVLRDELGCELQANEAELLVSEVSWPSTYTPRFNTLPQHDDGEVLVSSAFVNSNIFSCDRKRQKNCLRKRIRMWDDSGNSSLDKILYTGERLNMYDQLVFYALLSLHPNGTPIGREFFLTQEDVEKLQGRNIAIVSFEASMRRMRDCRIEIPDINFFGPLIQYFREVEPRRAKASLKKKAYIVSLNPMLTKLYRDFLYDQFMVQGDLFYHSPEYSDAENSVHYGDVSKKLAKLREVDFKAYTSELGAPWPTQEADMAAVIAIIAKNAQNGSVTFSLLDGWRELPNGNFEFSLPAWMYEAYEHFVDLYGEEVGPTIYMKATERVLAPVFDQSSSAEH